jgi:hypothetical protein
MEAVNLSSSFFRDTPRKNNILTLKNAKKLPLQPLGQTGSFVFSTAYFVLSVTCSNKVSIDLPSSRMR